MRISLNGPVIPDSDKWLYDYFGEPAICPKTVRQAIQENPAGETLEVEINSPGGEVFSGFEIYSLLRDAACPTTAIVQSLAASAAATMMAGCQTVKLSPVAQVMVHLPSTVTSGNQEDHRQSVEVLESITQSILNAYELKVGGKTSRAGLRAMMARTSWLSAQEAVDAGLADEIMYQNDPLPGSVVNAVGGTLRAALTNGCSLRDRAELLAQYEDAVRSGKAEAVPGHPVSAAPKSPAEPESHRCTDDWQAEARLNIEKNRFMEVM